MREEVGTAVAAEVTARPFCTGPALGRPVRSSQQRLGPGAPVSLAVIPVCRSSGRPTRGTIGSGVGKVLEANPFYITTAKRSSSCAGLTQLLLSPDERSAVSLAGSQWGTPSKGTWSHVWHRRHWENSLWAEDSLRTRLSVQSSTLRWWKTKLSKK